MMSLLCEIPGHGQDRDGQSVPVDNGGLHKPPSP